MDPNAELTKLEQQQQRASSRISNLEAEQQRAGQTLAAAREAVAQFHRRGGGRAAEQKQLEDELASAKAATDEPWAERIDGARRAQRDAHQAVQAFVTEHLTELIAEREAAGAAKAEEFNTHIEAAVRLYSEVQGIANEISGLASLVGSMLPGDVSRTRAEQLYTQMTALQLRGGEAGPQLLRDPRQPHDGAVAEVEQPEEALA